MTAGSPGAGKCKRREKQTQALYSCWCELYTPSAIASLIGSCGASLIEEATAAVWEQHGDASEAEHREAVLQDWFWTPLRWRLRSGALALICAESPPDVRVISTWRC